MIRRLLFLALTCIGVWIGGLLWFAAQIPQAADNPSARTDAIVVLTGGSGRLQKGLDLLADDKAEKLFVSGVYRGVEVRELLEISRATPEELQCCITLGYEADNTRGNAIETRNWLKQEGYRSIRLVTASYHMPRSLFEFRRVMPQVEIIAHAVRSENYRQDDWWRWPGSARLLISEYNKFLIARVVSFLDGGAYL